MILCSDAGLSGGGRIQNRDVGSLGWLRQRLTCLWEQGQMPSHRLQHELLGLGASVTGRYDAGQVWGVRRVARLVVSFEDG